MLFLSTTVDGIQLGLCYALVALGMYIAYSILDFPDLTIDGSFPLGGVIGTILIFRCHFPPLLALLGAMLAGALTGALTGALHVRFGITKLLSGIIVMTALLSGTLALTKLLTGTGYTINNFSYIANRFDGLFNTGNQVMGDLGIILVLLAIAVAVKLLLDLFFSTKLGFMLRAVGDNEALIVSLGRNPGVYKIVGLALGNGLAACGGALYAQLTMNYDNTSGSGKVVLALASVIIGLSLFSRARRVRPTTAVIVGAIIYSLCLNYFTLLDPDGTYLKLMNAAAFAVILILNSLPAKKKPGKAGRKPSAGGGAQ